MAWAGVSANKAFLWGVMGFYEGSAIWLLRRLPEAVEALVLEIGVKFMFIFVAE
jgi:hypothetical protein